MSLRGKIMYPFILFTAIGVSTYWFLMSLVICILMLPILLIQGLYEEKFKVTKQEWWSMLISFITIFKSITEK